AAAEPEAVHAHFVRLAQVRLTPLVLDGRVEVGCMARGIDVCEQRAGPARTGDPGGPTRPPEPIGPEGEVGLFGVPAHDVATALGEPAADGLAAGLAAGAVVGFGAAAGALVGAGCWLGEQPRLLSRVAVEATPPVMYSTRRIRSRRDR